MPDRKTITLLSFARLNGPGRGLYFQYAGFALCASPPFTLEPGYASLHLKR